MAHSQEDKTALGQRLASARKLAGFTIDGAAKALTIKGYPITKAAVGAWEKGRNLPDALWLTRLAKLYGTTVDSMVSDDSITLDAMRFAAQFDGLTERQKRSFRAMWLAYFEQSKTDAEVEKHLPTTPEPRRPEHH